MKRWSKKEVCTLAEHFPTQKDEELSRILNKSANAIRIKAHRLKIRKRSSLIRKSLRLTKTEEQVVVGGLLGDLSSRICKTARFPRLEGGHSESQKEYMLWKIKLLSRFKWKYNRTKINTYLCRSRSFATLLQYHNSFYQNGKKVVTREILELLDDFGLLIWYLDDGSYKKKDKSCTLHTNGFSLNEQKIIIKWFSEKYQITPRIHTSRDNKNHPGKIGYYLYFGTSETKKLFKILKQFNIPSCMRYKLGNQPSHSTNRTEVEQKNNFGMMIG